MRAVIEALEALDRPKDIFFRDDDAGWDMDALDRLVDIFAIQNCPLDLAVIPAVLDRPIASRLNIWRERHEGLRCHQHGFAHVNHEGPETRRSEFGMSRPLDTQTWDIAAGRHRLANLIGDFDPIFTPPWNRCAFAAARRLPLMGLPMLSADITAPGVGGGVVERPITFDWDRARREGRLVNTLAEHIVRTEGPIGIMLHHATLDTLSRATLEAFVGVVGASNNLRTRNMRYWLN